MLLIADNTKNSIEQYLSRESHPGLILQGEKGIGKRHIAEEIAMKLLETDRLDLCPDFILIESNGSILLDDLKKVKERANYCAVNADYKVYIIDDANTMNVNSQNSLLKLLEDANATNIFIFVAHSPLIETICSRCDVITVHTPFPDEVKEYYKIIGTECDELIMKVADNRIGLYNNMASDEKYVKDIKIIISGILNLKKKRDLFELFHVLKEGDSNSFYESYSMENVIHFMRYLKELFKELLYEHMNIPNVSGTDLSVLKELYGLSACINAIQLMDDHVARMQIKGQYSKNDFFDLIRYLT